VKSDPEGYGRRNRMTYNQVQQYRGYLEDVIQQGAKIY
jgi:hypothetical protein